MHEKSTDTFDSIIHSHEKEIQTDGSEDLKTQVSIQYQELPKPLTLDKGMLACPLTQEKAAGLDEVTFVLN